MKDEMLPMNCQWLSVKLSLLSGSVVQLSIRYHTKSLYHSIDDPRAIHKWNGKYVGDQQYSFDFGYILLYGYFSSAAVKKQESIVYSPKYAVKTM